MSKPTAIFVDVDYTLLSHTQRKIPDSAKDALFYARDKGAKVFVATGRHEHELEKVPELPTLPIDGFVTLNGALCSVGGEVIYTNPLSESVIAQVVKRLEESLFPCMFCDAKGMFISMVTDLVCQLQESLQLPLPPVRPPKAALDTEVLQIVTFGKVEEEFFLSIDGVNLTTWLGSGFDVVSSTANKWDGILHVCKHLGLNPADVATIGDADNDKEMLLGAGYSVAMGNAEEHVKACAKFVTDHIDEDGFAKAIDYLFKKT